MNYRTWLRRAGWPLALVAIGLVASAALADDDPPPGERPPHREPPPPGDGPAPPDGPGERVRKIIRRYAPGYYLNMSVSPVPPALDEQLGLKGEGVLVTSVREGGPADKSGIKAHDVVLAAGDKAIKSPGDLLAAAKEAEGKELALKLMRGGETLSINVTPQKSEFDWEERIPRLEEEIVDVRVLQDEIREKLKDAGVDLRMQFIEPGAFLPKGADFLIDRHAELPDDMSVTIKKEGKKPADVEVKQGDQSWTVKENELGELPDEVRRHVEGYLGRGPMRFKVVGPGIAWEGPRPPGPPRRPGDDGEGPPPPGGPDGPRPRRDGDRGRPGGDRPDGPPPPRGEDRGPGGPRGEIDELQYRERVHGVLEHRLDEMNRSMREMREQLEQLRERLRDERGDRPRRPDRDRPAQEEREESDGN